jgi:hypothetical protein
LHIFLLFGTCGKISTCMWRLFLDQWKLNHSSVQCSKLHKAQVEGGLGGGFGITLNLHDNRVILKVRVWSYLGWDSKKTCKRRKH